MPPKTTRLYHPKGPDRAAVVSVQPSTGQEDAFLIHLARGTGPGPLKKGGVYGPYAEAELEARFAELIAGLKAEGFLSTGLADLLRKLDSAKPAERARGALGLGWRRAGEAVEPILGAMPKAVDEVCSYLDALGAIGDPRALPVLREQAGRKLLSRRRSAVEALRNLSDPDGLAPTRQQALERLPDSVRQLLESDANAQLIADAVLAAKTEQRGLILDTLYELATPVALAVVRLALPVVPFDNAHIWRYVKSIYKRAMLRHDYATWGWLSHAIEAAGRSTVGMKAQVKSGYDGVQRETRIFGRQTQNYLRRLAWRYLRQLATFRPADYAQAAAEALIDYAPDDAENPRGLHGRFAGCYLLNRILWGASSRLILKDRSLRFRFRTAADVAPPTATFREEPYPHLWDAHPRAYLRLLAHARLPEVHAFAVQAIESRHPALLGEADHGAIVAMLGAPHEATVRLGIAELERRFDPKNPDWALLEQLLSSDRLPARELGERWLRLSAPLLCADVGRILAWLTFKHAGPRALAAEIVIALLGKGEDPGGSILGALAVEVLARLRGDGLKDDVAETVVAVARVILLDPLLPLISLEELMDWLATKPRAVLPLAGDLLGRRTEGIRAIGLDRLAMLAVHEIGAVRAGAHRLIRGEADLFHQDRALLLALAESDWEDTRKVAVELLRDSLRSQTLDLDGLLAFLDSNHVEVQNLGQELARAQIASVPTSELAFRLGQHPHPNMREFALDIVVKHLPDGAEPLARLEPFFRAALFDLWPRRAMKDRVLSFILERGMRDEQQAAAAVRILSSAVRLASKADFEPALEALVRLKLAYPSVASPVELSRS